MDFNELLSKYNDGIASKEEKDFVEKTVIEAREVATIKLKGEKPEKVRRKRSFGQAVKHFFIKLAVILLILTGFATYGFFSVSHRASENVAITKSEADLMAIQTVVNESGVSQSQLRNPSYKRSLVITIPAERSYYLYKYTYTTTAGIVYTVWIDSYSGAIDYTKSNY